MPQVYRFGVAPAPRAESVDVRIDALASRPDVALSVIETTALGADATSRLSIKPQCSNASFVGKMRSPLAPPRLTERALERRLTVELSGAHAGV